MPKGRVRDTTRKLRIMRLIRDTEELPPDCYACGHPFLAHHDEVGCLHSACMPRSPQQVSACAAYVEPPERMAA